VVSTRTAAALSLYSAVRKRATCCCRTSPPPLVLPRPLPRWSPGIDAMALHHTSGRAVAQRDSPL